MAARQRAVRVQRFVNQITGEERRRRDDRRPHHPRVRPPPPRFHEHVPRDEQDVGLRENTELAEKSELEWLPASERFGYSAL